MKTFSLLVALLSCQCLYAQFYHNHSFSREDSLRGALREERTCYDVKHYDLNLTFNFEERSISGYNDIHLLVRKNFTRFQIDLFENMVIDSIVHGGHQLEYEREHNAVFVTTRYEVVADHNEIVRVYYHGSPQIAKNAPWDGGFVWKKDGKGNTWAGVACEGTGASLWWPNKDHLGDEPESMDINLTVPKGYQAIANGRESGIETKGDLSTYKWKVSYPINNYNVSFYIGKYVKIEDQYGDLDLTYYVLAQNKKKATKHFEQSKKMLECFQHYFGPYPFKRDGYKLVESPYWGMEHQSAVAYGHDYTNNAFGFDFILVHESGHEWWGNHVSMSDHADLWIHEAFTTYSEMLYVEYFQGYEASVEYLKTITPKIKNVDAMHGPYHVNYNEYESADMYYKGAAMLHQFRLILSDDELWFSIVKGIQKQFAHQNITTTQLINYINKRTAVDYSYFFKQYIDYESLPELQYGVRKEGSKSFLYYRYSAAEESFKAPILMSVNGNPYKWLSPTTNWQRRKLIGPKKKEFTFNTDEFLVTTREVTPEE